MPEGRLQRTRAAYSDLPRGVIVDWTDDDAVIAALRRGERLIVPGGREDATAWRAPHENAAEQLKRRARLNEEVTSLVAAHVHGDAIAREMFDAFEAQRTGDESL